MLATEGGWNVVTAGRWTAAQSYERDWWEDYPEQIAAGSITQMEWYDWRARQLSARLEGSVFCQSRPVMLRSSKSAAARLKAILGTKEFVFTVIAQKAVGEV